MHSKIALVYGPHNGNTETVARRIYAHLGEAKADLIPVGQATAQTLQDYQYFIIGGATIGTHTWAHESTNLDWDAFLPLMRKADFSTKTVAVFGLGDQIAYAEHFVDDMRLIYDIIVENKGTVTGFWPTDGYEFTRSEALIGEKFVGLALDEDRQPNLSEERIVNWLNQILPDFEN